MAANPDEILDRRRLRRKLGFWRIAALLLAAAGALGAVFASGGFGGGAAKDHVAKIRIEGTITDDDELLGRLSAIEESDKAKGLIVMIRFPRRNNRRRGGAV